MAKADSKQFSKMGNDLTGKEYNRYKIISFFGRDKYGALLWNCVCSCGNQRVVRGSSLIKGSCRSCGCLRTERHLTAITKHGQHHTPENQAWRQMRLRCKEGSSNPCYGGRGIRVCQGWRESFQAWFDDMGYRPSTKHSVDRKDNNGHYSCGHCEECKAKGWPMNCHWATKKEQGVNRRTTHLITYQGKTLCVLDWEKLTGIPDNTLAYRIFRAGWTIERALSTPAPRAKRPAQTMVCGEAYQRVVDAQ
jgi:hypothetical protein